MLKLELDWASKHNKWEEALDYLTLKIEEAEYYSNLQWNCR